jgi:hypothetical protein
MLTPKKVQRNLRYSTEIVTFYQGLALNVLLNSVGFTTLHEKSHRSYLHTVAV